MKRKQNSKVVMEQKRRRREILTFWRILKYGANSFLRNAWLSVAATAVMTITLVIFFGSFMASRTLNETIGNIQKKVDISIYLKQDVSEKDAEAIRSSVEKLESVTSAEYTTPEKVKEKFATDNYQDEKLREALSEAEDGFFGVINVKMVDIGDTEELKNFIETDKLSKNSLNPDHKPTFSSNRKEIIDNISNIINFAEKVGIFAAVIFVAISGLIIFNTIRMAIFNRREEIYMMKLIGANKGFISGPFLIESIICGILASIFATGIGYFASSVAIPKLAAYEILVPEAFSSIGFFLALIWPALMIIGAIIGVLSSFFATRKYLKI